MAVAPYRYVDYGLNECSRVYGVPKDTIKRTCCEEKLAYELCEGCVETSCFISGHEEDSISLYLLRYKSVLGAEH
jgi:hypothetical protein